mmetsp:Transcript_3874/g.4360  ORF Transcript_3874/g.4360 Transcript_3874/m.4360 type:complete len:110 (-) Transcript_3874:19-348(-)
MSSNPATQMCHIVVHNPSSAPRTCQLADSTHEPLLPLDHDDDDDDDDDSREVLFLSQKFRRYHELRKRCRKRYYISVWSDYWLGRCLSHTYHLEEAHLLQILHLQQYLL